jgi:hypothetical protein
MPIPIPRPFTPRLCPQSTTLFIRLHSSPNTSSNPRTRHLHPTSPPDFHLRLATLSPSPPYHHVNSSNASNPLLTFDPPCPIQLPDPSTRRSLKTLVHLPIPRPPQEPRPPLDLASTPGPRPFQRFQPLRSSPLRSLRKLKPLRPPARFRQDRLWTHSLPRTSAQDIDLSVLRQLMWLYLYAPLSTRVIH